MAKSNLILLVPNRDISCISACLPIFTKYFSVVRPLTMRITNPEFILDNAKQYGTKFIATTDFSTFKLFDAHLEGTANDSVGAVITTADGFRVIYLPSLFNIFNQNEGKFLLDHFCSKLALGGILKKDRFTWEFCTQANIEDVKRLMSSSFLCAVDIETSREDLRITSVSYTMGHIAGTVITTKTFVVPCNYQNYPFCIDAIRMLNATPVPKVMQNGQYDATYFLRFAAPLVNWLYDTYTMSHAIYAELPKTLSFMSAFYLDDFRFWKDESGTNLYEYNGKDTHNTFWVWLAQLLHAPEYAITNYKIKFPLVFPCLTCALDGMLVDVDEMKRLHAEECIERDKYEKSLRILLSEPNFNPSSPKQVGQMFKALGYNKATGTDKKEMQKFKESNILYERIADNIKGYRGAVKAIGTYFELELLNSRLMYALDPSGTDTGRMASKSSAFWCGTQIQNIPPYARKMVVVDPGWVFGAVDKSQSESYCTGYISQDLNLIHAVTTSPDFHCHNASMFFGIPFEQLFDAKTMKKLNKAIRDIAKRVNHGANYNMGADVLLDTMGTKEVLNAKRLLKLPDTWSLRKVCEYLLACFDKAYPTIRGDWYRSIVKEVLTTGKLVTPTGYTRRTFLQPAKSKLDLNAAVAHKPQSFSVDLVNRAFLEIWRELQLKKFAGKFRLKAQVHDEIVFIATPDIIEEATELVAQMMVIPWEVNGRIMSIPSTKITGYKWSDLKD